MNVYKNFTLLNNNIRRVKYAFNSKTYKYSFAFLIWLKGILETLLFSPLFSIKIKNNYKRKKKHIVYLAPNILWYGWCLLSSLVILLPIYIFFIGNVIHLGVSPLREKLIYLAGISLVIYIFASIKQTLYLHKFKGNPFNKRNDPHAKATLFFKASKKYSALALIGFSLLLTDTFLHEKNYLSYLTLPIEDLIKLNIITCLTYLAVYFFASKYLLRLKFIESFFSNKKIPLLVKNIFIKQTIHSFIDSPTKWRENNHIAGATYATCKFSAFSNYEDKNRKKLKINFNNFIFILLGPITLAYLQLIITSTYILSHDLKINQIYIISAFLWVFISTGIYKRATGFFEQNTSDSYDKNQQFPYLPLVQSNKTFQEFTKIQLTINNFNVLYFASLTLIPLFLQYITSIE